MIRYTITQPRRPIAFMIFLENVRSGEPRGVLGANSSAEVRKISAD